jgi:hypothetical protein
MLYAWRVQLEIHDATYCADVVLTCSAAVNTQLVAQ